jgi:hypothetical protein
MQTRPGKATGMAVRPRTALDSSNQPEGGRRLVAVQLRRAGLTGARRATRPQRSAWHVDGVLRRPLRVHGAPDPAIVQPSQQLALGFGRLARESAYELDGSALNHPVASGCLLHGQLLCLHRSHASPDASGRGCEPVNWTAVLASTAAGVTSTRSHSMRRPGRPGVELDERRRRLGARGSAVIGVRRFHRPTEPSWA